MEVTLCATSDLHGNLPEIPPCDILVIAGDVCPHDDHELAYQQDWLETVFDPWLSAVPAVNVVGVAGNHDLALFEDQELGYNFNWTYLLSDPVEICGLKLWGTPWTPGRSNSVWKFHEDENVLRDMLQNCPRKTDIVVSHGPPHRLCDLTSPLYGSENAGSYAWRELICDVQPDLFICGHIHTGYGWDRFFHARGNTTTVCNMSLCQDPPGYAPINPVVTLKIDGNEVWHPDAYEVALPERELTLDNYYRHKYGG